MFKRANKITSLLIAAAAVVSLVPANAADVKKIDSEDGTIYNAVAYKDGKAYVAGEVNDDEEAYYVENGKFTALEDVESDDEVATFGEKYLDVEDGSYTVDLDAGTVNDDDIVSDTADDAAAALRKKIKNDTEDRYVLASNTDEIKAEADMHKVPGAKFADVWYYTDYAQTGNANNNLAGTAAPDLNVFTDTKGNYIDADYNLGKIKVTTTKAGSTADKTVTIENTNDKYETIVSTGTAKKMTAKVAQTAVLTQDKDYIYRLVNITIKTGDASVITEINGRKLNKIGANTAFSAANASTVSFPAIQKISKEASSDDVDGANYAKTVTTYVASNEDGEDVDAILANATYWTVAGGKLTAIDDTTSGKVVARAYTLKQKGGYYFADQEDESKEDVENSKDQENAIAFDVDGNLYRLDGGYIYKFDNTDSWDKVYKVDGSFDELSVYDADNMVAWSESDEVYSLIGAEKTDTTTPETPAVTTGWVQAADGTWTFVKVDGTKATGWINLSGTWYYLKADGIMATGWVNDNGTWYYLNASGAMLANTTVDGYVLGASGAWVK